MKIKFTLPLILILVLSTTLQARQRTIQEAKKVAISHYNSLRALRSAHDVDFELVYTGQSNGLRSISDPYYYVFNASDANGYVMVSGDDRIMPVLGYSTDGSFDPANIPSNMLGWFDGYEKQIDYTLSHPRLIKSDDYPQLPQNDEFPYHIEPMIKSEWSQYSPYNDLCPIDGGFRSVTGCVATAISQIMYYHKWPERAHGQISYHAKTLDRDISVNLEDYTFDWANMTDKYYLNSTDAEKKAVAELMYAVGAGCEMNYSNNGSGAYSVIATRSIKDNFGYDENVYCKHRDYCSSSEWIELIKTELTAKRPVVYSGQSIGGGHTFVCDGYDSDGMFHINWGWGGLNDGYFQLDLLNPSVFYDFGHGGYSYQQDAIVGIQKPNSGSKKTEGSLLQYGMTLSSDKYAQGDSLVTNAYFRYDGNAPANIEIGLAIYKGDELYELNGKDMIKADPYSIYYIQNNAKIGELRLPVGEYDLRYVYREQGKDDWKNVNYNKISNNYRHFILKASQDSIEASIISTKLSCSTLTADKKPRQNNENKFRTRIKNELNEEINPYISIYYNPKDDYDNLNQLTMEGIYLEANGEKDLVMSVLLEMEPGIYEFYVGYDELDGYVHFLNEEPFTFEVLAEDYNVANEKLNAPSDLKVAVSAKTLSVRSDSPVEELSIFNINGKMIHRISPAATDVTLSLGWASDGVYVVAVKNTTGWHRYKMIF